MNVIVHKLKVVVHKLNMVVHKLNVVVHKLNAVVYQLTNAFNRGVVTAAYRSVSLVYQFCVS